MNIQLRHIAFLTVLSLVMLSIAPIANAKRNAELAPLNDANQTLLLQGFDPDVEVFYTLTSAAGIIHEERIKTQPDGSIVISYNLKDVPVGTNFLAYDFKIAKDKDYLDILVRMNLATGEIKATGKGLGQFSDITFLSQNKRIETKSDWVGNFVAEQSFEQSQLNTKSEIFKLAFHGFSNILPQSQSHNSAIIKVLSAPNGGGPNNAGVNQFTTSPSAPYPLSTSSRSAVDASIAGIRSSFLRAMMLMTEQLNAVVMQQTMNVGQFFDAKMQMETQRLHQSLTVQAVKDYHPSDEMCRVGSYMRSVAKTEEKAKADKQAMNAAIMDRFKNTVYTSSAKGKNIDFEARVKKFREVYCDISDNNADLTFMCDHDQNWTTSAPVGGTDPDRFNKDIDFSRTVAFPSTLDIDYQNDIEEADEQDVLAMAKNLYWPNPLEYGAPKQLPKNYPAFMDARRVVALNSIAHNSFSTLASMKARSDEAVAGSPAPGWSYMKTMLREFGIADDQIEQLVGVEPSYWAQMEMMTKKMVQHPNFYTNLYNKPTNIDRMGVALDAIKLMQLRDHYNSQLRAEMLASGQVELELVDGNHYSDVSTRILANTK